MSDEQGHTVQEKIEAQREFCKRTKTPHFAPGNGVCWRCGRQIYDRISMESAANHLVTGCPHCHRSYVS